MKYNHDYVVHFADQIAEEKARLKENYTVNTPLMYSVFNPSASVTNADGIVMNFKIMSTCEAEFPELALTLNHCEYTPAKNTNIPAYSFYRAQ